MTFFCLFVLTASISCAYSYLGQYDPGLRTNRRSSFSRSRIRVVPRLSVASLATEERQACIVSPIQVLSEMPPRLSSDLLRNKYYLLRHGQSTANVAEVISSCRSLAYTKRHGLTELGYEQGVESSSQLLDILERTTCPGERLVLVSSPFARAYQTARACLDGLELGEQQKRMSRLGLKVTSKIEVHDSLVERFFGRLDGQALYTYAYVWPLDIFNATHTAFDVESVAAVCARLRSAIEDLEAQYSNCHIVLVSHADVLQIAQLYASGSDNVGLFSSYRFKNGEVREMVVGSTTSLPEPVPLDAPRRRTRSLSQIKISEKRPTPTVQFASAAVSRD